MKNIGMKSGLKNKIIISIAAFFLTALFLACAAQTSSADYQGPNSPGTVVDDATIGTVAWNDPTYAMTSDAVYATSASYIDSGAIPVPGIRDSSVLIIKSDDSYGTINKADTQDNWPGTETYSSYGSSSDLWGETWNYTKINDSHFGVAISAIGKNSSVTTHYLKATNFGFAIPTGADINGVLVEIEKRLSSSACILSDSYVQTPNDNKKIEDIKIGDKVFSFNEKTNKTEEDTVTKTFAYDNELKQIYYIYVDGLKEPMKVTGDHRIYTKDGYKPAEEIKAGDDLLNVQLKNKIVTKIEIKSVNSKIYNLEIKNNHNFFVNTLLVHNPVSHSWAKVDHIRITVYYTPASPPATHTTRLGAGAHISKLWVK